MKRAATRAQVAIRPGNLTDVDAMAAIEQTVFSDPWPTSAFSDLLRQSHAHINVAVDEHRTVCGYCIVLIGADEGEIANIAVTPAWQGQGIASRLLDEALTLARSRGVVAIFLEVRLSNDSARTLYESRGFLPVGRRRAYYRDPLEDALVLRWQAVPDPSHSPGPDGARKKPTGR